MRKHPYLLAAVVLSLMAFLPYATSAETAQAATVAAKKTTATVKKTVAKKTTTPVAKVTAAKKTTVKTTTKKTTKPTATASKTTTTKATGKGTPPKQDPGQAPNGRPEGHGISGTVSAISGTGLTLAAADGKTYSVDASKAKFMDGAGLADIRVGDKVEVMGTASGTSIVAKDISDRSSEGRTVFRGSVTAISGTSVTLKDRNGTMYTVDASAAKITKGMGSETGVTASEIKVGNEILALGTLAGSTVTATTVRCLEVPREGQSRLPPPENTK